MEHLELLLERAADELTRQAAFPPPEAIGRRVRRRRWRRFVVVLLIAAVAAVPIRYWRSGPWHLETRRIPSATQAVLPADLRPPPIRPGHMVVLIQQPAYGLPRQLQVDKVRCWHTSIAPASLSTVDIRGQARVGGQLRLVQVDPQRTAGKPGSLGALARVELRDDSTGQGRYLLIEGPGTRFHLESAGWSRGWVVGPHRLVDGHGRTLQPAGAARSVFSWWCAGGS